MDAAFDVVALAASAGGLTALSNVLADLPAGFPAGILVVQHLDPRHRSLMADILSRRTHLEVKQAEEGDRLAASRSRTTDRTTSSGGRGLRRAEARTSQ